MESKKTQAEYKALQDKTDIVRVANVVKQADTIRVTLLGIKDLDKRAFAISLVDLELAYVKRQSTT